MKEKDFYIYNEFYQELVDYIPTLKPFFETEE